MVEDELEVEGEEAPQVEVEGEEAPQDESPSLHKYLAPSLDKYLAPSMGEEHRCTVMGGLQSEGASGSGTYCIQSST